MPENIGLTKIEICFSPLKVQLKGNPYGRVIFLRVV